MNRKAIAAALMLAVAYILGACNTIEGMGRDVEKGGQKVEREAAEHKKY